MTTLESRIIHGETKRLRIACSSLPFSGHLNPLMTLAEALVARNNEVFLVMLSSGAKDNEKKCKDLGIQLVELKTAEDFDQEWALKSTVTTGKVPFPNVADHTRAPMMEALDAIQPDLVLSDFCCFASQEYAAMRNIPLVLNWPGPLNSVWDVLRPVINADSRNFYFASGGLFVSYVRFNVFRGITFLNAADLGRFVNNIVRSINCGNSMVLMHSFYGLEKAHYLFHPNIVPVGPIEKLPSTATPDFSKSHPELHSFLNDSITKKRKLLMVTTGSVIMMENWMVKLLWEAFEKLTTDNVSIVWSLKEERQAFLSDEQLQHPAFHFSTWLPQPALLASNFIDGVFTHCGWGGTSECLLGGKPVVVMPFFVDQMTNAKLLLDAGCATSVAKIPDFNTDPTGRSSYRPPTNDDLGWLDIRERLKRLKLSRLTVDGVVEGCQRLLKDPRYKRSAEKLRALGSGPGKGRDFACDLIEHAGHHGLRHLTESGGSNEDDSLPQAATHASRLTGHRPLVVTLGMGAIAGAAIAAIHSALLKTKAGGDF
mmetsp:Transcript_7330/g.17920  ORF Transcript_7330/g.17920 Transcript_7330/m.17920 type:complete len:540 (-) Transcript_7330:125-1744(-)